MSVEFTNNSNTVAQRMTWDGGVQNLVEVVEGLETLKSLEIIDLADNLVTGQAQFSWSSLYMMCHAMLVSSIFSSNLIRSKSVVVANKPASVGVEQIRSVSGLACCPELRQLNLSGNKIRTAEDIIHLQV